MAGLASTAAPFLIALAIAWMIWRVWDAPVDTSTGVRVWATTVAAGMLVRRVFFDDGTATAFVIVATVFLGVFLVGWRLAFSTVVRRRTAVG